MLVVDNDICICILDIIMEFKHYFYDVIIMEFGHCYIMNFQHCYYGLWRLLVWTRCYYCTPRLHGLWIHIIMLLLCTFSHNDYDLIIYFSHNNYNIVIYFDLPFISQVINK